MTSWAEHHAELSAADDVVSRRLEDEVVLVNLRSNRIFSLNRTGARYWELLLGGNRRAEIAQQLAREFGVEPDEVAKEIDKLEQELVSEGLVTETV